MISALVFFSTHVQTAEPMSPREARMNQKPLRRARSYAIAAMLALASCPEKTPAPTPAPTPTADGGTGGNQGGQPPETPGAITPLPASTFVYYRMTQEGDRSYGHLWSYDVVSKQNRLISKLDNSIGSLRSIAGDRLAISPDRKWIAFAAHFRPSKADEFLAGRTTMIWKVSADGAQFVRISAPLKDWRKPCSAGCDSDTFCEPSSDLCTVAGWSWQFEHPSWSPDGKKIFAHLGTTACWQVSCLPSVVTPNVPAVTAISEVVVMNDQPMSPHTVVTRPAERACNTATPAVSPDGKRLAVDYSHCFGSSSWGVMVSDLDGSNYQTIGSEICNHIAWRSDSAGVYCSHGNKLSFFSVDKTQTTLLNFPADLKVDHFTFSPDGRWFVANLQRGNGTYIAVADLNATPITDDANFKTDFVTDDGVSAWPSF
jgi:Tol biopolymer transport system component